MKLPRMPQDTTPVPGINHEVLPERPRKGNPKARTRAPRPQQRDRIRVPKMLKAIAQAADVDYADSPFVGLTPDQRFWLVRFSMNGQAKATSEETGIPITKVYLWRRNDPRYVEAERIAYQVAGDIAESEAFRRGVDGVDEPVYQGGRLVGHKRVYSDGLLLALLKGLKRERYGDSSKLELTGKDGGPVSVEQVKLAKLSNEELEQLAAMKRKVIEVGEVGE